MNVTISYMNRRGAGVMERIDEEEASVRIEALCKRRIAARCVDCDGEWFGESWKNCEGRWAWCCTTVERKLPTGAKEIQ